MACIRTVLQPPECRRAGAEYLLTNDHKLLEHAELAAKTRAK